MRYDVFSNCFLSVVFYRFEDGDLGQQPFSLSKYLLLGTMELNLDDVGDG